MLLDANGHREFWGKLVAGCPVEFERLIDRMRTFDFRKQHDCNADNGQAIEGSLEEEVGKKDRLQCLYITEISKSTGRALPI